MLNRQLAALIKSSPHDLYILTKIMAEEIMEEIMVVVTMVVEVVEEIVEEVVTEEVELVNKVRRFWRWRRLWRRWR